MTSAPGKKQLLPIPLIREMLEYKRSSENDCRIDLSIESHDDPYTYNLDYFVTMNLVLHENIQSEYKQFIYRSYRRLLTTYINAHPNDENDTNDQFPFFVNGAGTYEGEFGLAFTYVLDVDNVDSFPEDDDPFLGIINIELNRIVKSIFKKCFSNPNTALLPLGEATAENYKMHYKLKEVPEIEEDSIFQYYTEARRRYLNSNLQRSFPFVLVNNKQIAFGKYDGLQMRQYTDDIAKLKF